MSAETLRRAAALMRKRAEAALREHVDAESDWYAHLTSDGRAWIASSHGKWLSAHGYPNCAEHIAGMHPAVALAVACWLDSHADIHTLRVCGERLTVPCPALTVARAYLGESA
jgi:hypothetical protein